MCARRKRGASTAAAAAALCAMCLLRAAIAVHGQTTATEPPDPAPTTPSSAAATATAASTARMPADDDGPTTRHPPHAAAGKNDDADVLRQVLAKKCANRYTMTCLKLDLIRLVDRLGAARAYQLVPGVSLVRAADYGAAADNRTVTVAAAATGHDSGDHQQRQDHRQHSNHGGNYGIPPDVARSLIRGDDSSAEELDGYLMEKVDAYLSSLSVSVKLVDSSAVENVRKIGGQVLVNMLPTDLLETGRGKKDSMRTALWSAGALAAVGFASLAAMSGKALMTAMLALALAAMCALKGQGGGGGGGGGGGYGKTSHYEIITKPAIYEHDHLVHGAAYSSAPYNYARHLSTDEAGGQGVVVVGGGGGGGGGSLQNGVGLAGVGVGGAYRVGGVPASPPQQQHVSVVHAAAPASRDRDPGRQHEAAAEDGEDEETALGQASYPLSPIAYIPTTNNA